MAVVGIVAASVGSGGMTTVQSITGVFVSTIVVVVGMIVVATGGWCDVDGLHGWRGGCGVSPTVIVCGSFLFVFEAWYHILITISIFVCEFYITGFGV